MSDRETPVAGRHAVRRLGGGRRRVPLYQRKRFLAPLIILCSMLLTIGWLWWITPVENHLTGERELRGDRVSRAVGNLIQPKKSLVNSFAGRRQVSVLILGLDHVVESKRDPGTIRRADSQMVATTDFTTKQIRLASIPRDGWVEHWQEGKSRGHDLAANTFAYGQMHNLDRDLPDREGGIQRAKETIEHLLGLSLDFYIVVEFEGLVKLIDALGGLDVDVEKDMNYDDRAQNLHIHLKKGPQHLDGTQVMGYARYRHDALGDLGRMPRQQKVIQLVLAELRKPANLPRLPQLAQLFAESVQTNLSMDQLFALAQHMDEYAPEAVQSIVLDSYNNQEPGQKVDLPGLPASNGRMAQAIYKRDIERVRAFLQNLEPPPPPEPAVEESPQAAGAADDSAAEPRGD